MTPKAIMTCKRLKFGELKFELFTTGEEQIFTISNFFDFSLSFLWLLLLLGTVVDVFSFSRCSCLLLFLLETVVDF